MARGAGLPDIILHGTATLALAISEALRQQPRGAATPVRAVTARFGTPGAYNGYVMPTATGTYIFTIKGKIDTLDVFFDNFSAIVDDGNRNLSAANINGENFFEASLW